jgi:hypothetical protein
VRVRDGYVVWTGPGWGYQGRTISTGIFEVDDVSGPAAEPVAAMDRPGDETGWAIELNGITRTSAPTRNGWSTISPHPPRPCRLRCCPPRPSPWCSRGTTFTLAATPERIGCSTCTMYPAPPPPSWSHRFRSLTSPTVWQRSPDGWLGRWARTDWCAILWRTPPHRCLRSRRRARTGASQATRTSSTRPRTPLVCRSST